MMDNRDYIGGPFECIFYKIHGHILSSRWLPVFLGIWHTLGKGQKLNHTCYIIFPHNVNFNK